MTDSIFGTDGVRGRVGEGMIRPDRVLALGWAAGSVMRRHGMRRVLIGKDTRISGYMFESALQAGLIAAGIHVELTGPMPTPAIAYLTRTFSADLGVVISASHNPFHDNGIKFFAADGSKLDDALTAEIEASYHEASFEMAAPDALGRAHRIDDAPGRYIEFCKSTYRASEGLHGWKIVLDCANGATYHIAPNVFRELGAEVIEIGTEPDGLNINAGCGATDTRALRARVLESGAHLGIAFDGDGDRVVFVDDQGIERDGDDLLYVLACGAEYRPEGVVGTVMSNEGLVQALARQGIAFERTPVGDRHVMRRLKETGWCYGAEPSGHVLCMDRLGTGDGIVAALQVLAVLVRKGQGLREALSGLLKYPSRLRNVRLRQQADKAVLETEAWCQMLAEAERLLGEGRVLVRPSGTEPLIRVLVEGPDMERVEQVVDLLVGWLETRI